VSTVFYGYFTVKQGNGEIVDGLVRFRDDDDLVNWIQFDVVDQCDSCTATPFSFDPRLPEVVEGWIAYGIWCTTDDPDGQWWVNRVTLKDKNGLESEPFDFTVTCLLPPTTRSLDVEFGAQSSGSSGGSH
jgi:hypothetical protein